MDDHNPQADLLGMTADIVSAYVSNNSVTATDLPGIIAAVHGALSSTNGPDEEPHDRIERPTAAQIRKSVTPEYIVSFEDGRQFKSMKRTLSLLNMTPTQYREKWGLPSDYPMVAPGYAARRSELAKSMGLGSGVQQSTPRKSKAKAVKAT